MRTRLARRQHERAFERSYRRHVGDVYHYALGVLGDPDAAEQVAQTTFLNAHREFCRTRGGAPGLNVLLTLAHDVCRMRGGFPGLRDVDFSSREEDTWRAERWRLRSCDEAEFAVSRELDDRLSRREKRPLRAHLRVCGECRAFARGQQEQREAIRALAAVPLPATLQSFFGTRPARFGLRTTARLTTVAATAALVVALISSGGLPHPASFIGQEPEPAVDAAVVTRAPAERTKAKKAKKTAKAKKAKKAKRKFRRSADSP